MQATTPEDNSFFSREKEELPRAGLEPAIICILGRCCTCTCMSASLYSDTHLHTLVRNLHVLKHLHPLLGVALADLAEGLVLVPALLDILGMQLVHLALLAVITGGGQVRGEGLGGRGGEENRKHVNTACWECTCSYMYMKMRQI